MMFLQISADFFHQNWKILLSTESSLEKDAKRCRHILFSSSGSGDIREKRKVEKQGGCVFLLSNVYCFVIKEGKKFTQIHRIHIPARVQNSKSDIWEIKLIDLISISCRAKQNEVMKLEEQIRCKAEEQRKAGQELDSTCQICLKTKFADGIGHTCNYCNVRCCARCGGKVALRSSKVRLVRNMYLY